MNDNKRKKLVLVIFLTLIFVSTLGQKLRNGTYIFSIRDAEYVGHPVVAKCKVIIAGEKIKVIYTDSTLSLMKFGDTFDEGILMYHKKTKQWIIGHSNKDINANEVGGCSDGPRVIDLRKKEIWSC